MMILVILANVLMMAETLYAFQFVPENCEVCDEFNATATSANDALFCDCEPEPHNYLISAENSLYYVFTVEYLLKIVFFSPTPVHAGGAPGSFLKKLLSFLFLDIWQLIDFVCLAPFYLSMLINLNSLTSEYNQFTFDYTSLRILRITRVFQVVKLGRNSQTFTMFIRVVKRSAPALKLLAMILAFGAIIFASLIYECERGVWEYTEITDPPSYQYMRFSKKSKEVKEIMGYGDMIPTSLFGEMIAGMLILLSMLVVAFPISVFTNLWKNEYESEERGASMLKTALVRGSEGGGGDFLKISRVVETDDELAEEGEKMVEGEGEGDGGEGKRRQAKQDLIQYLSEMRLLETKIEHALAAF
ncbi:hypothetical protein ScalyP_jg3330 [Parmales sp. scaly parma]|nr:hypothetical protein ScalyP_jg3330 [Parmales sp. scaly parma]